MGQKAVCFSSAAKKQNTQLHQAKQRMGHSLQKQVHQSLHVHVSGSSLKGTNNLGGRVRVRIPQLALISLHTIMLYAIIRLAQYC